MEAGRSRSARGWSVVGAIVLLSLLAACSGGKVREADGEVPAPRRERGGAFDSGFGNAGTAVIGLMSGDSINALLRDKRGGTVAIGSSLIGDKTGFLLMRVLEDGSLDPSFGVGGRIATAVGQGNAEAWAAAMLPDGRITVAGSAESVDGDADIAVSRYSPDGRLDLTFGRGGVVITKVSSGPDTAFALATDGSSRTIVGGQCGRVNLRENTRGTACIVRLGDTGSVDVGFGANGARLLPIRDGVESLRGIAVDARGRIVASGYSSYSTANELTLFRLSGSGDLDNDFGDLGSSSYRGRGFTDAFALSLQGDGIVVAGFSGEADGTGKDFLVARFLDNGRLDREFGDRGVTLTSIGSGDDVAFAVATDARGIVLAGYTFNGKDNDMAVVRYSASGKIDESFGNGGMVTFPLGAMAVARGIVQDDRTITLGGELKNNEGRSALLARVTA